MNEEGPERDRARRYDNVTASICRSILNTAGLAAAVWVGCCEPLSCNSRIFVQCPLPLPSSSHLTAARSALRRPQHPQACARLTPPRPRRKVLVIDSSPQMGLWGVALFGPPLYVATIC